ncbi:ubiquitin thioesterase OTU1 [Procambarus clarkii]|uniref:ubiquitin thioesterase OTU1 n=1 Tax=Procambarus clarkii TaxID=6728 RepID=UPI001E67776C|nr:ubiquitin thioesterase OTU1-like [Procambarus clarkii]XP_045614112.1 ubiquitin thioesterase OTU1-like [Procambarus clarkii]XP_045614114.1 ubiquitin thioesterase OTU1-like [Procambarus clarkii]XP_045614115.1 ubiquitin thioesterase OTU1-like [Procambarus clarkii]XP_045614116.1 ubiquitin thioesterase OTU1-like [Procambarus clarkii]
MLRLRVKTSCGEQYPITERVSGESTLHDLLSAIQDVTAILPQRQKILAGFPPKPITGNPDVTLNSIGIRNGEMLIVEDVDPSKGMTCIPQEVQQTVPSSGQSISATTVNNAKIPFVTRQKGILLKKVVPSDNSCLFASVYYLINGGEIIGTKQIQEMRQLVATLVKSQPEAYDEAVLERSNSKYCEWILKDTSWGGAIELSILSQYYEIEIVALNAKTGNLNRFGEDKRYDYRMIVMYDGIHYDPIYMETFEGDSAFIFPSSDDSILDQAKEMAIEAKQSGQYTDTNAFQLECKQCGTIIAGEDQALAHAKKTGHSKFEEVHRN